jgi:hypothetical protein
VFGRDEGSFFLECNNDYAMLGRQLQLKTTSVRATNPVVMNQGVLPQRNNKLIPLIVSRNNFDSIARTAARHGSKKIEMFI